MGKYLNNLNNLDARLGGMLSGMTILSLFIGFWVGIGVWMAS